MEGEKTPKNLSFKIWLLVLQLQDKNDIPLMNFGDGGGDIRFININKFPFLINLYMYVWHEQVSPSYCYSKIFFFFFTLQCCLQLSSFV